MVGERQKQSSQKGRKKNIQKELTKSLCFSDVAISYLQAVDAHIPLGTLFAKKGQEDVYLYAWSHYKLANGI